MRVNRKRLCQACAVELQTVESAWLAAKKQRAAPAPRVDPLDTFLSEWCEIGPALAVDIGALYVAYRAWCDVRGARRDAMTVFHSRMTRRGFRVNHDTAMRYGLALRDDQNRGAIV